MSIGLIPALAENVSGWRTQSRRERCRAAHSPSPPPPRPTANRKHRTSRSAVGARGGQTMQTARRCATALRRHGPSGPTRADRRTRAKTVDRRARCAHVERETPSTARSTLPPSRRSGKGRSGGETPLTEAFRHHSRQGRRHARIERSRREWRIARNTLHSHQRRANSALHRRHWRRTRAGPHARRPTPHPDERPDPGPDPPAPHRATSTEPDADRRLVLCPISPASEPPRAEARSPARRRP